MIVTFHRAIDHFVVGKRHCRVLHRPTGRWLYSIGRSILPITQNQETAVPCPYKLGDSYIPSGTILPVTRNQDTAPCRFPTNWVMVTFDRAINYYPLPEIRTRHCRFPT
ncbi:hypothetical protein [Tychonema sp. LEGE 06208]|uniref:hypothetical protein n=1 Tax=Tychonema sp. LEGE 06208 TaxID=1828663 RepID=UPI0030D982A0